MVHYQQVEPFCEYILNDQVQFYLVEKYVAVVLRRQLKIGCSLKEQASSQYLIETHDVANYPFHRIFQLKPDILIQKGSENIVILDCKWKLLDSNNRKEKQKISSSDMCQLYVYGNKYLKGNGKLFLIYPESETFSEPLPVFKFDDKIKLWIVPF